MGFAPETEGHCDCLAVLAPLTAKIITIMPLPGMHLKPYSRLSSSSAPSCSLPPPAPCSGGFRPLLLPAMLCARGSFLGLKGGRSCWARGLPSLSSTRLLGAAMAGAAPRSPLELEPGAGDGGDDADDAKSSHSRQIKRGLELFCPYPLSLLSTSPHACQEKHGADAAVIRAEGKCQGFRVLATNKRGLPYTCHMCRAQSTDQSGLPGREVVQMPL